PASTPQPTEPVAHASLRTDALPKNAAADALPEGVATAERPHNSPPAVEPLVSEPPHTTPASEPFVADAAKDEPMELPRTKVSASKAQLQKTPSITTNEQAPKAAGIIALKDPRPPPRTKSRAT